MASDRMEMNQFYSKSIAISTLLAIVLFFVIGRPAGAQASDSFKALYSEAKKLQSSGKPDLACLKYREALKLKPDSCECMYELSRVLIDTRRLKAAESLARRTVKLSPESSKYQANLGAILSHQSKDAEAEKALRKAIKLDPGNVDARYHLAKILSDSRQDDSLTEAVKQVKMAVLLEPKSSRFHSLLGDIYYLKKQFRDSLYEYKKAQELSGGKLLNGNLRQRVAYLKKVLKEEGTGSADSQNSRDAR